MKELSLKNFIHESAFLAPEVFNDLRFMDEFCWKYFGVKYSEILKSANNE